MIPRGHRKKLLQMQRFSLSCVNAARQTVDPAPPFPPPVLDKRNTVTQPAPSTQEPPAQEPSTPDSAAAITLTQLRFSYGKKVAPVLDIPHWQLPRGAQVFLKGASGSGKSSLLNLLAGILHAAPGAIQLLGQDPARMSSRQRDRFRARHVGLVFQQFNLIPYLSVLDNIRLAHHFAHAGKAGVQERTQQLFDALKLDNRLLQQRADRISVGQQQRVAIARALINGPEILLADEPTSALDSELRDRFIELLLQLCRQQGSTLVFVSHDSQLSHHFPQVVALDSLNQARQVHHVF
jgi:putative ABC transport system ATP-binding protein